MIKTNIELVKLEADEGKLLTNEELYVKAIYLGSGEDPNNWREVDESEKP